MPIFNLAIDTPENVTSTADSLKAAGVTVNIIFKKLTLLNVTATSADVFKQFPHIKTVEEELTVTATSQAATPWQQLRIATDTLPLKKDNHAIYKGFGSTVYLVDEGIDLTHPDLKGADIIDLWSYNGVFNPGIHGTTLATLIVGDTLGIAPHATVKSVVIPTGNAVPVTTILSALDEILDDHSKTPNNIKVVNCSWLINKSQILDQEIQKLESGGLVVVAAAGNSKQDSNLFSPVGLDSVLGVGASDVFDRVIDWAAGNGSNWGPDVDITAPGINVVTMAMDGTATTESGTSVAAAITSGILCHFIERYPTMSAADIQNNLVAFGLQNVLFRDETIYGTTPNVLTRTFTPANIATDVWGVGRLEQIIVQRGTSATLTVTPSAPITEAGLKDFTFPNGHAYFVPKWASFANNTVTVTPPADQAVGRYPIIITGSDGKGNAFTCVITACVYDKNASEVNTAAPEAYYVTQTGDTVSLRLQFCVTDADCSTNCCTHSQCNQGQGCKK